MGGGAVFAVLWLARRPDVERLRKDASDDLLSGQFDKARRELEQVLEQMPRDAPGAARRRARGVGRRTVRLRRRGARARAPLRAPHARSRDSLSARRGAVRPRARRRGAARAPHRGAGDRQDADRADGEAVAGAHLRPPRLRRARRSPLRVDAAAAARQRRGGRAEPGGRAPHQRGLDGRRARAAPLPGARAEERPRPRDARLGAGGGRRSRRRARGAAQPVDDLPTPAHDRDYGRALERAESFAAARDRYQRALAEEGAQRRRDAARPLTERMLFRTTPELAGGGSLRSDPQAWAWRVQAGAALPFGTRHALGVAGLARLVERLEREPGRRLERALQDAAR